MNILCFFNSYTKFLRQLRTSGSRFFDDMFNRKCSHSTGDFDSLINIFSGIAHRDLKFDNLLCNDPEDFTQVKICDFDLGGQKLDIPYQSTPLMDSPVGSAEFMAPEVVDLFVGHKSTYDKRCDMWSLGITVYIMLFGRPPFTGRCGLMCGWDDGHACASCQELLFQSIRSGRITFPPDNTVSDSAKDLIGKLLVKDARKR